MQTVHELQARFARSSATIQFEAGPGQWRVRATFPTQGDYAYSESPYVNFDIGTGYRLIGRQSNRCMSLSGNNGANGTPMILWDCSGSPNPGDGQVFTFVPMEACNEIFQLKINSSGKCVDVTGVSTADGALLQQWDCLGGGQTNQLWDIIPIEGDWPYIALRVQHSGKCADVLGQAEPPRVSRRAFYLSRSVLLVLRSGPYWVAARDSNSSGERSPRLSCKRAWLNQPTYSTIASSSWVRVRQTRSRALERRSSPSSCGLLGSSVVIR